MKKPIFKQVKPTQPKLPLKYSIKTISLDFPILDQDTIYSLEDFFSEIKRVNNIENVSLDQIKMKVFINYEGIEFDLFVSKQIEKHNDEYESEMQRYLKQSEIYQKKLEKYEESYLEYQKDLNKYEQWVKNNEIKVLEKRLRELKNEKTD